MTAPTVDLAGQTPPRDPVSEPASAGGTNAIRGRVTRAEDGAPIHAAQIWLARDTSSPLFATWEEDLPTATTDDQGRFEFQTLPSGQYVVTAAKSGFVALQYGQSSLEQSRQSLRVGSGTVLEAIDFALPRAGAAEGQVIDDRGDPIVGVEVRLLRREQMDGVFHVGAEVGVTDRTDDDGRFRVHGVPPGRYLLAVRVLFSNPPLSGGRVTYYPGTMSLAEAQLVEVVAGGAAPQLVVGVRPTATARAALTGQVVTPDGQPVVAGALDLLVDGESDSMWTRSSYRTSADGTFRVANLEPGTYSLTATAGTGLAEAHARVVLDGVDTDVRMVLDQTRAVRGRFSFGALTPPSTTVGFEVLASNGRAGRFSAVQEDWTFEVTGLNGPVNFVATTPSGWTVDRIRSGEREVKGAVIRLGSFNEQVVEIRVTNHVTRVMGVVKDRRGQAMGNLPVVVYTADSAKRKDGIHVVPSDESGQFEINALEPGRYFVAVADPAMFDQSGGRDIPMASILERLQPSATSLTVREGQTETIEIAAREL